MPVAQTTSVTPVPLFKDHTHVKFGVESIAGGSSKVASLSAGSGYKAIFFSGQMVRMLNVA
jgi:hypothetical protein